MTQALPAPRRVVRPAPPHTGQITGRRRSAADAASATPPRMRSRGPAPKRSEVLARCRPTPERAAAAARLVGSAAPALKPNGRTSRKANLEVVDDSKRIEARRQRRTRLLLAVAATIGFAVALTLVYVHVVMAQRQFVLDKLSNTVVQQQQTYEQLRYEVAQLGSPAHIITMAEGQLGLVQPPTVTYLTPAVTIPGDPANSTTGSYTPMSGQAPAGDADWPTVKAQLAGQP